MKVLTGLKPFQRSLLVLGLLLIVAGASYGFAMWKETQAANEYRAMIYNMTLTMAKHPGCLD